LGCQSIARVFSVMTGFTVGVRVRAAVRAFSVCTELTAPTGKRSKHSREKPSVTHGSTSSGAKE
jgi:hypothetical protein